MPGEGFAPMEFEPYKKRGTMSRRVPVEVVEPFPTVLYKGEVVGLDEMDPEASSLRVKFFRGGFWIGAGSQTAARLDGWRVQDEHDNILESPYMDPEDPRLELIPGRPLPRSAGPLPVPVVPSAGLQRPPDPAADRRPAHNRFIARLGDQWYIALWNVGDPVATLIKTRTMPGEGFAPVEGEPDRSRGLMSRQVPAREVEAFPTLLYRDGKVQLGEMDAEASALRMRLLAPYFMPSGERSSGFTEDWKILDDEAQVLESPFMEPTDPRVRAIPGLPLVG
jgi:hypothetical protein